MALSKAISFLVICFYLLQKILIYDTISPTPHGKGRRWWAGAYSVSVTGILIGCFLYDVLNPTVGWLRRS